MRDGSSFLDNVHALIEAEIMYHQAIVPYLAAYCSSIGSPGAGSPQSMDHPVRAHRQRRANIIRLPRLRNMVERAKDRWNMRSGHGVHANRRLEYFFLR